MTALISGTDAILGCAVCFGEPGHAAVIGANLAIALMLVILVMVLGSIAGFIVYLARKENAAAAAQRAGITLDLSELGNDLEFSTKD